MGWLEKLESGIRWVCNFFKLKKDQPDSEEVKIRLGPEQGIKIPEVWLWRTEGGEIYLNKDVYEGIFTHGKENLEIEVGGILVGNVCQYNEGRYRIDITDYIKAKYTRGTIANMTFTHESWNEIYKELELIQKPFLENVIVGWYHTHPGHGVFLSGLDLYIQQNFFPNLWQVALVVDLKNNEGGFFFNEGNRTALKCKFGLNNPSSSLSIPRMETSRKIVKISKKDLPKEEKEILSTKDKKEISSGLLVLLSIITIIIFGAMLVAGLYTKDLLIALIGGGILIITLFLIYLLISNGSNAQAEKENREKPVRIKIEEPSEKKWANLTKRIFLQKPLYKIAGIVIFGVILSIAYFVIQHQIEKGSEKEKEETKRYKMEVKTTLTTTEKDIRDLKNKEKKYQISYETSTESNLSTASERINEADALIEKGKTKQAKENIKEAEGLIGEVQKEIEDRNQEVKDFEMKTAYNKELKECKDLLKKAKENGLLEFYDQNKIEFSLKEDNVTVNEKDVKMIKETKEEINEWINYARKLKEEESKAAFIRQEANRVASILKEAEDKLRQDTLKKQGLLDYAEKESKFSLLKEEILNAKSRSYVSSKEAQNILKSVDNFIKQLQEKKPVDSKVKPKEKKEKDKKPSFNNKKTNDSQGTVSTTPKTELKTEQKQDIIHTEETNKPFSPPRPPYTMNQNSLGATGTPETNKQPPQK